MSNDQNSDLLHRYLFTERHVRGELVQISTAIDSMLANHNYPQPVQQLLGELLAATCLLTATLKFEGDISVQLQGDGPVSYAVVNGNHQQQMRAVARINGELNGTTIPDLFGKGYMVITLTPADGESYQGVAPLEKPTLAACIEDYFAASEQLRTRIWLSTAMNGEDKRCGGLLLQVLPVNEHAQDDFDHLEALTNTITDDELLLLPAHQLLTRLYHEDNPELFEPQPIGYLCGCSREKTAQAILRLGEQEATDIVEEQGNISIQCQFCLTDYVFDAIDVEGIFSGALRNGGAVN